MVKLHQVKLLKKHIRTCIAFEASLAQQLGCTMGAVLGVEVIVGHSSAAVCHSTRVSRRKVQPWNKWNWMQEGVKCKSSRDGSYQYQQDDLLEDHVSAQQQMFCQQDWVLP